MGLKQWLGLEDEKRSLQDDALETVTNYFQGATITRKDALSIPSVNCAVELIAGTLASLPIKLYQKTDDGTVEQTDDKRTRMLNDETGTVLDAWTTKKALITDLLLEGECYLYIDKKGAFPREITYIPSNRVALITNSKLIGCTVAYYIDGEKVDSDQLMRVVVNSDDGLHGRGVLKTQALLLSTMFNAMKFENRIMRGGRRGFVKSQRELNQEQLNDLRKAWSRAFAIDDDSMLILNSGIDFIPSQGTPVENQLNENKMTNADLAFMIFGLDRKILQDEDTLQTAVKTAMSPIIKLLETALNRYFLLESEKGRFFFMFDTYELMKSDNAKRYQAYAIGLKNGWLTIDEVREKENLKGLGLDFIKMGLESVLYYPKTKEIYVPNTGQMTKNGTDSNLNKDKEVHGKEVKQDESGNQK